MQIEFQKRKLFFVYFVLSALALYFIFSSAIHIPFYHHDIYKYSIGGLHNHCRSDPGFGYLFTLGRPVSAILDCYNYKLGNSFASISYLRILCILLTALAISLFAVRLHSVKLFFWPALFLSGAIFLLPAIQTTIIMVATTLIFSILMAFLAHYLISKSHLFARAVGHHYVWQDIIYFVGGIISLFISLFTYPSLSSCFLLPLFILILFRPLSCWYDFRKRAIRDTVIFILNCFVYFIVAKMLQTSPSGIPANYQFKLNFHFLERIIFLYQHFSSLWMIHASFLQIVLINFVIISGFAAGLRNFFLSDFFKNKKNKPIQVLLQVIMAVFILLLLGSLTLLVVPSYDIPIGRVIFVLQAMSILIIGWSLNQITALFRWNKKYSDVLCAGILFFIGACTANYNITKSGLNDKMELDFITENLIRYFSKPSFELKRIHIISPAAVNFNGLPRGDDILNDNSTRYAGDITYIVNTAFLQLTERHRFALTNCMFSETEEERHFPDEIKCMKSAPKGNIVVTYSRPEKPFYKTSGMLVIDMNGASSSWLLLPLKR